MQYCGRVNLTPTDLDYIQKIYAEKSWAWWLNHIGNDLRSLEKSISSLSLGTFFVFIIGFCGNLLCLLILCRRGKFTD